MIQAMNDRDTFTIRIKTDPRRMAILTRARELSDEYEIKPRLDAIRELSLRVAELESELAEATA